MKTVISTSTKYCCEECDRCFENEETAINCEKDCKLQKNCKHDTFSYEILDVNELDISRHCDCGIDHQHVTLGSCNSFVKILWRIIDLKNDDSFLESLKDLLDNYRKI